MRQYTKPDYKCEGCETTFTTLYAHQRHLDLKKVNARRIELDWNFLILYKITNNQSPFMFHIKMTKLKKIVYLIFNRRLYLTQFSDMSFISKDICFQFLYHNIKYKCINICYQFISHRESAGQMAINWPAATVITYSLAFKVLVIVLIKIQIRFKHDLLLSEFRIHFILMRIRNNNFFIFIFFLETWT